MALGKLYLVGTPIGNLADITMRAIKTLQTVDLIAAEDTRHTGKLLHHFAITTPQVSYHSHNSQQRIPELVELCQNSQNLALVTDAGMPSISDPGLELVQACLQAQIAVIPIPGVSACLTALVASGISSHSFVFAGFLAADTSTRRSQLEQLAPEARTIVLYEAPHRLVKTLIDLNDYLGSSRQMSFGRELTKIHEQFWYGTIAEAITYCDHTPPRGEFTLVIAGAGSPVEPKWTNAQIKSELAALINSGMSRSQSSRELASLTNLPKNQLYQIALTIDLPSS